MPARSVHRQLKTRELRIRKQHPWTQEEQRAHLVLCCMNISQMLGVVMVSALSMLVAVCDTATGHQNRIPELGTR